MGLFAVAHDDSAEENLNAAKANLELYMDHRRNEVNESMLYLLKMTVGQIEAAQEALQDD